MKRLHTMVGLLAVGMVLTAGSVWGQDSRGTAGPIVAFGHNDDSSNEGVLRGGSIYIDEGGGVLRRYIWSRFPYGALCVGRFLSDTQQLMLLEALQSRVFVIPFYRTGNASQRCLLSFVFATNESDLPNLNQ